MKSKISTITSGIGFALFAPLISVFAKSTGQFSDNSFIFNAFGFVQKIIGLLFPIVSAVLILLFGYQLIMFLWGSKDDIADHDKFRKGMINAFIAVLLWFILFGLINVVANAIGVNVGETVGSRSTTHVCLDPDDANC